MYLIAFCKPAIIGNICLNLDGGLTIFDSFKKNIKYILSNREPLKSQSTDILFVLCRCRIQMLETILKYHDNCL